MSGQHCIIEHWTAANGITHYSRRYVRDHEELSGIGWLVVAEFDNPREAGECLRAYQDALTFEGQPDMSGARMLLDHGGTA